MAWVSVSETHYIYPYHNMTNKTGVISRFLCTSIQLCRVIIWMQKSWTGRWGWRTGCHVVQPPKSCLSLPLSSLLPCCQPPLHISPKSATTRWWWTPARRNASLRKWSRATLSPLSIRYGHSNNFCFLIKPFPRWLMAGTRWPRSWTSTSSCSPPAGILWLQSSRSRMEPTATILRWVGDKQVRFGRYIKLNDWLRRFTSALRSMVTTRSASTTPTPTSAQRQSTLRSSTRTRTRTTTSWETSSATMRRWMLNITRSLWQRLR